MERSRYKREPLSFVRYALIHGGDMAAPQCLPDALVDPVAPLSRGREAELALVEAFDLSTARESKCAFTELSFTVSTHCRPCCP